MSVQPSDSPPTPECVRGSTVSLSPFSPSKQFPTTLQPSQQRLFDRIIAEDGVELETFGRPPIQDGQFVSHEATIYRIEVDQLGTEMVSGRTAALSWEKGQSAPSDETVTEYSTLPDADQNALDLLVHGPEYSRDGLPTTGMSVSNAPAPYPDGTADSALVGVGTTWVEWDNRVYEVTITDEEELLAHRTYDYSATQVAASEAEFRAFVADRFLVSLDDLSNEEQSVLETAIEAGEDGHYQDCNEPSPGYKQLRKRMEGYPGIPSPRSGWYVAYEGERYLLNISGWVY
ncbi:hypothetical protein [Halomarina rubra]|uniref:DUF7979 domain-containing protein n=1 Tax=Halomarina rubra TaxID=2071873 RepID=A0ABD6AXE5_9EURY|nr:hypothetical protein [Halomarina rubra]